MTLASIIALVSTGTIVVVLARALRAINPETETDVQREYQRVAVTLAARDELLERESQHVMAAETGAYTFSPAYPGPGLTISVADPGQRVVRDVLVWRLRVLMRVALLEKPQSACCQGVAREACQRLGAADDHRSVERLAGALVGAALHPRASRPIRPARERLDGAARRDS